MRFYKDFIPFWICGGINFVGTLDICVYGSFFSTPDPSSYGRWLEIVAHPTSDHAHAHSGLQVINFRKVSIVHKELFKEFEMRLYMSGTYFCVD